MRKLKDLLLSVIDKHLVVLTVLTAMLWFGGMLAQVALAVADAQEVAPKAPPEASSAYVNRRLDGLLEEKAKPVIISNAKKQELVIASLQLENAKLRLKEFQAEVTKAEDNVAAFWKSIGIDPTKLATDWQASDGQNGDIILTRKEPERKPDAPKQ